MSDQYIVSARKYRPSNFRSVVGQKNLTNTLKNAIASNRVAQAYLFCGPRGVGKTSCARIFAKTINCLHPTADGEACGECENCKAIDSGSSYNVIELDAASNNGVDNIRNLTEQVNIPPQLGKYRIFIIDEVHMLTSGAFNAFLKTLEEPPAYVVFILATTEKHKVIPTILSRCQIYDFKRITVNDMAEHLAYVAEQEGIKTEPTALNIIARKADGAMRDALSIFDQVAASSGGNITYEAAIANLNVLDYDYYFRLVDEFKNSDIPASLLIYKEIREKGFDSLFFINGLADHIRDLMVAADPRTVSLLETASDLATRYSEQASSLPLEWYYAALRLLNDCDRDYRTAANKRLLVELTLIRLCQLLKPATPPFEMTDRRLPLRNPSTTLAAQPTTSLESKHSTSGVQPTNSTTVAPTTPASQSASLKDTHITPRTTSSQQYEQPVQSQTHLQPAQPTTRRRAASLKTQSISSLPDDSKNLASLQNRNNPFTEDDFKSAWKVYIEQFCEQGLLGSAMRANTPSADENGDFIFIVSNSSHFQAFEANKTSLLTFLRDQLENDNIRIKAEIDNNDTAPRFLQPAELLKKIVRENPVLGDAISMIDGEIS